MPRSIFFQINHTIAYMHSKNICHKDLKLENILLMDLGPTGLVKVTDFGLSKQFSYTNLLETSTPYNCKSDC